MHAYAIAAFDWCPNLSRDERVEEQNRLSLALTKMIVASRRELTDEQRPQFKTLLGQWTGAVTIATRMRRPLSSADLCHFAREVEEWQWMLPADSRISGLTLVGADPFQVVRGQFDAWPTPQEVSYQLMNAYHAGRLDGLTATGYAHAYGYNYGVVATLLEWASLLDWNNPRDVPSLQSAHQRIIDPLHSAANLARVIHNL